MVTRRMTREDFRSMLGEGFHTAFRKGVDSATASQIHRLISAMRDREWSAVIEFVVDGFEVTYPGMFDPPAVPDPPAGHEWATGRHLVEGRLYCVTCTAAVGMGRIRQDPANIVLVGACPVEVPAVDTPS